MKNKPKKLSSYQKQKALIEKLQKRNAELIADIREIVMNPAPHNMKTGEGIVVWREAIAKMRIKFNAENSKRYKFQKVKSPIKISDQKMKLITDDIYCYHMGQLTLKGIAIKRGVPYSRIIKIANQMISKQLHDMKKTEKFR